MIAMGSIVSAFPWLGKAGHGRCGPQEANGRGASGLADPDPVPYTAYPLGPPDDAIARALRRRVGGYFGLLAKARVIGFFSPFAGV